MAPRVCRISTAAIELPSTKAGMMVRAEALFQVFRQRHVARRRKPAELHRNRKISMMPSQKFGVEIPHNAKILRVIPRPCLSSPPKRYRQAPRSTNAMMIAMVASCAVTGSALRYEMKEQEIDQRMDYPQIPSEKIPLTQ